jgi:hypothetical protein
MGSGVDSILTVRLLRVELCAGLHALGGVVLRAWACGIPIVWIEFVAISLTV